MCLVVLDRPTSRSPVELFNYHFTTVRASGTLNCLNTKAHAGIQSTPTVNEIKTGCEGGGISISFCHELASYNTQSKMMYSDRVQSRKTGTDLACSAFIFKGSVCTSKENWKGQVHRQTLLKWVKRNRRVTIALYIICERSPPPNSSPY